MKLDVLLLHRLVLCTKYRYVGIRITRKITTPHCLQHTKKVVKPLFQCNNGLALLQHNCSLFAIIMIGIFFLQFSRNKLHAIHTTSSHIRAPLTQFFKVFFVLKQVQFAATLSNDNGGGGGIGGQNVLWLLPYTLSRPFICQS